MKTQIQELIDFLMLGTASTKPGCGIAHVLELMGRNGLRGGWSEEEQSNGSMARTYEQVLIDSWEVCGITKSLQEILEGVEWIKYTDGFMTSSERTYEAPENMVIKSLIEFLISLNLTNNER